MPTGCGREDGLATTRAGPLGRVTGKLTPDIPLQNNYACRFIEYTPSGSACNFAFIIGMLTGVAAGEGIP
jgi:hypothetical protein